MHDGVVISLQYAVIQPPDRLTVTENVFRETTGLPETLQRSTNWISVSSPSLSCGFIILSFVPGSGCGAKLSTFPSCAGIVQSSVPLGPLGSHKFSSPFLTVTVSTVISLSELFFTSRE